METTNKWLLAIAVLLPTYLIRFSLWGIPLNLLDLIIAGGFVYCLVHHHGLKVTRVFGFASITLLLIGIIAILVSDHPMDAIGIYKSYLVAPIMVGAMIQTAKPRLQYFMQALGCSVIFIGLIAALQWLTGYGVPGPWYVGGLDVRMTSVYDYPNAVGLFCAPVVALSIAWLLHERSARLFHAIVILIGCLAIGLSQSDGAVLAVVIASGFTLLFTQYRKWVIGLGLILAIVVFAIPATRNKVLLQDTSGEVRLALWQGTVSLLKDRPLQGAGLANFPDVYAEYKLDRHVELLLYPHNLLLDFWVEFGLLGAIWILAVLVYFFVHGFQALRYGHTQRTHGLVLLTGMVALLAYGLVDVPYFKNDLAVIFWSLLALGGIIFSGQHTQHVRR